MIKDHIKFSLGTLRHRKLRTWLTMIGIFIGIASVVALMSLGEGLRGAVLGQFGFLGPDVLSVQASGVSFAGPPGQGVTNPLTESLTEKVERVPGVEAAINRYIETGILEFNDKQEVIFAWNMPEGSDGRVLEQMLSIKVQDGRVLKDGDSFNVLVGADYKEEDLFGKPIEVGSSITFKGVRFRVVGILEKKGSFIFDSAIVINEKTLKDQFRSDDESINVIAIKVEDVNSVSGVKQKVEQLLRRERDVREGEEDFTVQSPENALESLDQTLFAVQLFISIIAAVSILVGGIGISNTMYTAVLERTKEIGIMKSIGARNSDIFLIFLFESGFLGIVGGVIGILLGMGLAFGGAYLGQQALGSDLIQAKMSAALLLGALFFSFIIGVIAGFLPALRAAKKHPVEAVRYAK